MLGCSDLKHELSSTCPLGIKIDYPEPSSEPHGDWSVWPSVSSKCQPSIQASRVTLAATLDALTILNFESTLVVTVKLIPGNKEAHMRSLCPTHRQIPVWPLLLLLIKPRRKIFQNLPPIVRFLWLAPLGLGEWLRLGIDGLSLWVDVVTCH